MSSAASFVDPINNAYREVVKAEKAALPHAIKCGEFLNLAKEKLEIMTYLTDTMLGFPPTAEVIGFSNRTMIDYQIDEEMILRDEISDEALEGAALVTVGGYPTLPHTYCFACPSSPLRSYSAAECAIARAKPLALPPPRSSSVSKTSRSATTSPRLVFVSFLSHAR